MSVRAWQPGRRPRGERRLVLLVLVVLAGLVGMHGLGPVTPFQSEHAVAGHRAAPAPQAHAGTEATGPHGDDHAECDCDRAAEDSHGGKSGHAAHADSVCASGGVSGGPALPALQPGGVIEACPTGPAGAGQRPLGHADRAPPDLAQLQILRI